MTEQNFPPQEYLLVGEIVAAFGIRGQLKVRSLTDNVEHLRRKIKTLYVGSQRQAYRVKDLHEHKPGLLIVALEGVTGRTEAENLRGSEVAILAEQALPLNTDEYFIHDLYGLEVLLESGERLGKVREVVQTGANDVLVVARENESDALIPVIRDVVIELDVPNKRVVVRPLPGLLSD